MRAHRIARLFEVAILKCACLLLLCAPMALGADQRSIGGRIVSATGHYTDVQADRFAGECAAADGQHSFGVLRRDVHLGRERICGKVR